MRASRVILLLASATLLLALASPATAGDRVVLLDGGKSWAVETDGALTPLAMPEGDVLLHKAVSSETGRLAAGIERLARDGQAVETLVLFHETSGRMPTPKQTHDAVTYAPTPVMERGALTGLVWIEGFAPNQTRVLAADWTGAGWSQPIAVSKFGPGTQIALDVTRLGDGSLLAVWAAYDGEDDEIVWSRKDALGDGSWSEPRPITANSVPDVTPTLHATQDGAVVAWSGYDGNDYRIQMSHLTDGTWSAPSLLEGKGAVWPVFQEMDNGQAALTWRQAVPRTWMAAAVDGDKLLWTAPADQPSAQVAGRPLATAKDGAVRLLWPVGTGNDLDKATGQPSIALIETTIEPPAN